MIKAAARFNGQSEDLSLTKKADDGFEEDEDPGTDFEDEAEQDMFESALERSKIRTWNEGGIKKDKVLNTLITKFGMLIEKNEEYSGIELGPLLDEIPVDKMYSKLPTTVKSLGKLIL